MACSMYTMSVFTDGESHVNTMNYLRVTGVNIKHWITRTEGNTLHEPRCTSLVQLSHSLCCNSCPVPAVRAPGSLCEASSWSAGSTAAWPADVSSCGDVLMFLLPLAAVTGERCLQTMHRKWDPHDWEGMKEVLKSSSVRPNYRWVV